MRTPFTLLCILSFVGCQHDASKTSSSSDENSEENINIESVLVSEEPNRDDESDEYTRDTSEMNDDDSDSNDRDCDDYALAAYEECLELGYADEDCRVRAAEAYEMCIERLEGEDARDTAQ